MQLLADEVTVISLRLSPLTLLSNMAFVGVPSQVEADQLIQRLDGVFLEEGALRVANARVPFASRSIVKKPMEDLWNRLAKRSTQEEVKRTTERFRVSMSEGTARTIPRWLHDLFEGSTPAPEIVTSALRYRDRRTTTPRSRRSRSATASQVTPFGVTPQPGALHYSLPAVDEGIRELVVSDLTQEELDQWIEDSWTGRIPFDGVEPEKRGGGGYVSLVDDTSDVNHWRR